MVTLWNLQAWQERRLTTKFSDRPQRISTRARRRQETHEARSPAAVHFMRPRLAATQSYAEHDTTYAHPLTRRNILL